MSQASYLFRNNVEIAARYAVTTPDKELYDNVNFPTLNENEVNTTEVVVTRYLVGHRLKIQSGVMYTQRTNLQLTSDKSSFWSGSFQIEIGI